MTDTPSRPKNRELAPQEWEALRIQWITAGRPHVWRFLAENGHPNRTGGLRKRVSKWQLIDEIQSIQDPVDNVVHLPRAGDVGETGARDVEILAPSDPGPGGQPAPTRQEVEDAYKLVMRWRERQAVDDYKTADLLRSAIKVSLADKITKIKVKGKDKVVSSLKPTEARQYAQALESIQRVQRLSLGLSTDNLGISSAAPATTNNVEQNEEEAIPTFTVEIGKSGKFARPRPRRTS